MLHEVTVQKIASQTCQIIITNKYSLNRFSWMSIPVHSSNLLHRMLRMSVGTNGGPMLGREGLGAPQCDGRQGLRRPPRHRRRRCRSWSEAARAPPSPVMWLPQVGSSHRFFRLIRWPEGAVKCRRNLRRVAQWSSFNRDSSFVI